MPLCQLAVWIRTSFTASACCPQVSAYGFITPDYTNYSDHYYDRDYKPVGFFINHDLRLEMVLWQSLHRAGLIRLYMNN